VTLAAAPYVAVALCAVAPAAQDATSVDARPAPESPFYQSASFTLSEAQPAYRYEFVATRKGRHTAVVKCEGAGAVVPRSEPEGGNPSQAKRTGVVRVSFAAASGTRCALEDKTELHYLFADRLSRSPKLKRIVDGYRRRPWGMLRDRTASGAQE
jgi:hypothetical protein